MTERLFAEIKLLNQKVNDLNTGIQMGKDHIETIENIIKEYCPRFPNGRTPKIFKAAMQCITTRPNRNCRNCDYFDVH